MRIRTASSSDAEEIAEIARKLTIDRHSPLASGFVEYPILSADEYRARIEGNPLFLVAAAPQGIAGFCASYTAERVGRRDFDGDPVARHLRLAERPFVYADQLAVGQEHRGSGVGTALLQATIASCTDIPIYTAIVCAPHVNPPAQRLVGALGWRQYDTLRTPQGLEFALLRRR